MGCSTCTSGGGCGTAVKGCNNNGGCKTGGCNKLNVFDWLVDMEPESGEKCNIIEVRFKGTRKEFYRTNGKIELTTGDPVVVNASPGFDLGFVSMQGELVRLQLKKKGVKEDDKEIKDISRKAMDKDLEKYEKAKSREMSTMFRAREVVNHLGLQMKLSDVEFQADNSKATFYYSAEDRVDFRELIKALAAEFRVRVEMRQISLRQEAGRLGGIGSCGRELCCSTWLSDFKSVSTNAARYQNLSINPTKLSGQCGRLKCCLNYELDTYMGELDDMPEVNGPLFTQKGEAELQRTDIFNKVMWFSYKDESNWYQVPIKRVREILDMNAKGKKPYSVDANKEEKNIVTKGTSSSELERMDKKFKSKNKDNKPHKKRKGNRNKKRNKGRNNNTKPRN